MSRRRRRSGSGSSDSSCSSSSGSSGTGSSGSVGSSSVGSGSSGSSGCNSSGSCIVVAFAIFFLQLPLLQLLKLPPLLPPVHSYVHDACVGSKPKGFIALYDIALLLPTEI